ncbi:MAG: ABC transporter substrate-binding protein [Dehalococcoidia bacterium]
MSDSSYWQRKIAGPGLGRRTFLRSAAVTGVGAAAFLAGCKSNAPSTPAAGGGAAGGAASASSGPSLGVFQVPEGKRGGTLVDVGIDPTTGWDSHTTSAQQTTQNLEPLHIKLIRHDYRKNFKAGDDTLIGELAEKWESPDPLTYNFTLRKGINWPDQEPMKGRPITAQDVKYAFDACMSPTAQVQEYVFGNIASTTAVDDGQFQIKLKQPNLFFPSDIDSLNTMIVPKGIYEWAGGTMKDPAKVRGGGPWLLEEYRAGSLVKMKPNEAYRKVFGVPYADNFNVAIVATGAPRLTAFVAKNVMFFAPAAGQLETAKKSRPDAKVIEDAYPSSGGTSISIKQIDNKPFDDVRIRRAMSMAIDRDGWGKTFQVPYKMESGPISWGYPTWKLDPAKLPAETAKLVKYDVAEAKKLLDASGFKQPGEILMHYYPYSPDYAGWSQFLLDSFSKIGMKVTPKVYEYNNWLGTAFIGKYTGLMFGPDASIDRPSPMLCDRLRKGSARNHSFIEDATTQKMLADFWGAKSIADAKPIAEAVQARSISEVFSIYSPMGVAPKLWDPAVQNYNGQQAFNHQFEYKNAFYWLA